MANTTTNKLFRSETDRIIAGVCGGLGKFFDLDSTIIRIIFVLLALGVVGILLYVVLMFVIPAESNAEKDVREAVRKNAESVAQEIKERAERLANHVHTNHQDTRIWLGVGIAALGVIWLLQNLNIISGFNVWKLWPIFLILLGLVIIGRRNNNN